MSYQIIQGGNRIQIAAHMQRHVDRTLAADRKGGEALWYRFAPYVPTINEGEEGEEA